MFTILRRFFLYGIIKLANFNYGEKQDMRLCED